MESLRYLLILTLCVLVTLPLEFVGGARVYRRPRRLLSTVLPVVLLFGAWDLAAAGRGDWAFNPRYTVGARLLGLPIEEWLFFVVVPVCALLTFDVLARRPATDAQPALPDPAEADHHGR
jgi:lycopene cyclase domain-containing protein